MWAQRVNSDGSAMRVSDDFVLISGSTISYLANMSESSNLVQEAQHEHVLSDANDDLERASKRVKLDNDASSAQPEDASTIDDEPAADEKQTETILPPSIALLGRSRSTNSPSQHTEERDVGISEYLSKDLPPIHAIIKQRYAQSIFLDIFAHTLKH